MDHEQNIFGTSYIVLNKMKNKKYKEINKKKLKSNKQTVVCKIDMTLR